MYMNVCIHVLGMAVYWSLIVTIYTCDSFKHTNTFYFTEHNTCVYITNNMVDNISIQSSLINPVPPLSDQ